MKIFPAPQIRQWDAFTIQNAPVSSEALMERAAHACFLRIADWFSQSSAFVFFCGTGNNGGDGLAIARMMLQAGRKVSVYILEGEKRSHDFEINFARLQPLSKDLHFIEPGKMPVLNKETIVIDALFGTGLSRPLQDQAARLVQHLNEAGCTVISIDIPSGLFADTSSKGNTIVEANHTLTFQIHKLAFMMSENGKYTGKVHVLDIGLDAKFYNDTPSDKSTIDNDLIASIYKPRDQFLHKYNFGHALLYAGSESMMGAAILCAKSCLRAGAGLVTVHTVKETQPVIQTAFPEAITSSEYDWKILSRKKAAIGLGPGLEVMQTNELLLSDIVAGFDGGIVIDATGLLLLAANLKVLEERKLRPVILTPHTGEFEKLFGKTSNDFNTMQLCIEKAAAFNCYIVLKGHHTMISCPDGDTYFNINGNAGMATAGSGDVLTGILTSLLAQGYTEKDACLLGVYLHGMAGDIAAEKHSQEALIASDIVDNLGACFKQVGLYKSSGKLLF